MTLMRRFVQETAWLYLVCRDSNLRERGWGAQIDVFSTSKNSPPAYKRLSCYSK